VQKQRNPFPNRVWRDCGHCHANPRCITGLASSDGGLLTIEEPYTVSIVGLFKKIYGAAGGAGIGLNLATKDNMAAIMPAPHEELGVNSPADLLDSDQDAEGEEDTDLYQLDQELQSAVQKADDAVEDDDEPTAESDFAEENRSGDESAEDVASRDHENDDEFEVSQKLRRGRRGADASKSDGEESDAFENGLDSHSESNSNESDQEAEDWEAESNGKEEDHDGDKIVRSNCM
jgi:hypothetical protein